MALDNIPYLHSQGYCHLCLAGTSAGSVQLLRALHCQSGSRPSDSEPQPDSFEGYEFIDSHKGGSACTVCRQCNMLHDRLSGRQLLDFPKSNALPLS